ncbi:MAG: hypothetical protein LUC43_01695 [Burkholderiales bacterium]|nr:hypothetical protein [Burkholderiales bacterium]
MLLQKLKLIQVSLFVTGYFWVTSAFASNGDTDFADLYDKLSTWSQGTLGRSIALMFLLVGLGVGVIRGSIMGAVVCIAAAMALFIGPQIIDNIFTALI